MTELIDGMEIINNKELHIGKWKRTASPESDDIMQKICKTPTGWIVSEMLWYEGEIKQINTFFLPDTNHEMCWVEEEPF